MSWVRIDDQFPENPKVMDLPDRAFRLYVTGLCYSARNLTDGILTDTAVRVVSAIVHVGGTRRWIICLTDSGLWVPIVEGFRIKDFLDYNPTKIETVEKRKTRAEAGRQGGIRSGEAKREAKREANYEANALPRGSKQKRTPSPSPLVIPNSRTKTTRAKPVSSREHEASEAGHCTNRLLREMRHSDEGTRKVLLSLTNGMSPGQIEGVRESMLELRPSIRHDARWAVKRLKTIKREAA